MKLELVRSTWGVVDDLSSRAALVEFARSSAELGYDAVAAPAGAVGDLAGFVEAVKGAGLAFLPQLFTWGRTVDEHVSSFRASMDQVSPFEPRLVTVHAGRDSFDDSDATDFFRRALAITRDHGFIVAFETHRTRILFAPWRTLRLLEAFEELRLNCDFSHWVCVAERLRLGHEVIAACAERAAHIDARVGHEEGPQVSDPRAPEFALHLETFLGWWRQIVQTQRSAGAECLSVTPEFGPPPYQPTLPFGGGEVGDRHEINAWMAGVIRDLGRQPD
jgi:sugar phosphate isomerase/epimerase